MVQKGAEVNTLLLQEDIAKGQRVEEFLVEGQLNGSWQTLAAGTTVGYKRLVRFASCQPEQIRVSVRSARGKAHLLPAALYFARPLEDLNMQVQLGNVAVSSWKIMGGDDAARMAADHSMQTVWRAEGLKPLTVDMGQEIDMTGFTYAPAPDDNLRGIIYKYTFEVSIDGKQWQTCETSGEFSNIMHNPLPYRVDFSKSYRARYFRLTPKEEINSQQATSIAEIGVFMKQAEK